MLAVAKRRSNSRRKGMGSNRTEERSRTGLVSASVVACAVQAEEREREGREGDRNSLGERNRREERERTRLVSLGCFIILTLSPNDQNAPLDPDLVSKRAARQRTHFDEPNAIVQLVSPNSRPKIKWTKMPF